MSSTGPPDPHGPQPLNYHQPKRRRLVVRTLYIVLISLFVGAAVLFGTCWMAFHR